MSPRAIPLSTPGNFSTLIALNQSSKVMKQQEGIGIIGAYLYMHSIFQGLHFPLVEPGLHQKQCSSSGDPELKC